MKKILLISFCLFLWLGATIVKAETLNEEGEYNAVLENGEIINIERQDLPEVIENPEVTFIEPNYIRKALGTTPNDPDFSKQWYLYQDTGVDINAKKAWDDETGNGQPVVAIIDTGMDMNHADLEGNLWVNEGEIPNNFIDDDDNGYVDDINGWDFVDDNNNLNPIPDGIGSDFGVNHGTHIAGIVGADSRP